MNDLAEHPEIPHIAETGRTFEDNAILKAVTVSKHIPGFVVADDSGLEVDALGGAPGFTPPVTRDRTRVTTKTLRSYWSSLGELALRRTHVALDFVACWRWRAKARFSECLKGLLRDKSLDRPRGSHGFGYDPIFIPNGFQRTFGELEPAEKNRLSHRARALGKVTRVLNSPTRQQKSDRDIQS